MIQRDAWIEIASDSISFFIIPREIWFQRAFFEDVVSEQALPNRSSLAPA